MTRAVHMAAIAHRTEGADRARKGKPHTRLAIAVQRPFPSPILERGSRTRWTKLPRSHRPGRIEDEKPKASRIRCPPTPPGAWLLSFGRVLLIICVRGAYALHGGTELAQERFVRTDQREGRPGVDDPRPPPSTRAPPGARSHCLHGHGLRVHRGHSAASPHSGESVCQRTRFAADASHW